MTTPLGGHVRTASLIAGREAASVRRVIAITYGVPAADVPDAVVRAVVESDRVPVCWCHVEALLARPRTAVRPEPGVECPCGGELDALPSEIRW